jgi:hypothetical protein
VRVKLTPAAAVTASALLGVVGIYDAHASTTYVGCTQGMNVTPKVRPGTCDTWYPGIVHADSSGVLLNLRWTSWGGATATPTGQRSPSWTQSAGGRGSANRCTPCATPG